jgi:hypothetical protein
LGLHSALDVKAWLINSNAYFNRFAHSVSGINHPCQSKAHSQAFDWLIPGIFVFPVHGVERNVLDTETLKSKAYAILKTKYFSIS